MFHISYLAHTKEDLQKVARECKSTDNMQYTGADLYLLDIPRNFCAWVRLGTPRRQKSHMALMAQVYRASSI